MRDGEEDGAGGRGGGRRSRSKRHEKDSQVHIRACALGHRHVD